MRPLLLFSNLLLVYAALHIERKVFLVLFCSDFYVIIIQMRKGAGVVELARLERV